VSSATPNRDLLVEANRLEAAAIEAGEEGATGRQLRGQAAALRVHALGERVYPVLVCRACFQLTGWLDGDGRCDSCLRRVQRQAAYSDPHGGWVRVEDERAQPLRPKPANVPLRSRLAALRHPREAHRRALVAAWMAHVRPDETGPIDPEDGYELEIAKRNELDAADGSGKLVRFHTSSYRFSNGDWAELDSTTISRRDLVVPPEFPASLPTEQLLEAWGDYKAAVDAINRTAWSEQSERREQQRQAQAAHEDTVREQRDVIQLLDEN